MVSSSSLLAALPAVLLLLFPEFWKNSFFLRKYAFARFTRLTLRRFFGLSCVARWVFWVFFSDEDWLAAFTFTVRLDDAEEVAVLLLLVPLTPARGILIAKTEVNFYLEMFKNYLNTFAVFANSPTTVQDLLILLLFNFELKFQLFIIFLKFLNCLFLFLLCNCHLCELFQYVIFLDSFFWQVYSMGRA